MVNIMGNLKFKEVEFKTSLLLKDKKNITTLCWAMDFTGADIYCEGSGFLEDCFFIFYIYRNGACVLQSEDFDKICDYFRRNFGLICSEKN